MPELKLLHADHAPAVLAFELANRAYFAASVSDRGDDYFDRFTDRYQSLLAEQDAGVCAFYVLVASDGDGGHRDGNGDSVSDIGDIGDTGGDGSGSDGSSGDGSSGDTGGDGSGDIGGDGLVLGRFNLYDIAEGSAVLGYRVARHAAGRGLATAAVIELCARAVSRQGLHTLRAATADQNVASQRVLVKAGFVPVGPAAPAELGGKSGLWYRRDL
ncbi:MAG TPA: GNAT family N-acetyltransferase [Actinoplanes sp.]|nr:GNAT family N-acetyltransferase [Actinoplanes sp.]